MGVLEGPLRQRHQSALPSEHFPWYCIRTRSNCERIVSTALGNRGYKPFVPVYTATRQWSDRVVTATTPLFSCYLFCRFDASRRTPILSAPGVISVLGFAGEPTAIPEAEVDAIRALVESGLPLTPSSYFREGQPVRINQGVLEGVEGTLVKVKGRSRFVVSVPLLQRSVAVEIDPSFVSAGKRYAVS